MSSEQFKLRVSHLNVYHLVPKLPDVSVYINTPNPTHIFGVTETRLSPNIPDSAISITNFSVIRRDPLAHGQTGIAVYIHKSVDNMIRRRTDLENDQVECVWIELKNSKGSSSLICILYRNPRSTFDWYDDFFDMCEKARLHSTDVLILGDFNIDLLKPHNAWDSTTTMLGLTQLVASPTRITPTTSTLLDHIYTNKPSAASSAKVDSLSVSDHFPR